MIDNETDPGTYIQVHDAPVDGDGKVVAWSSWRTIKRANPLIDFNPHLRPKLGRPTRGPRA